MAYKVGYFNRVIYKNRNFMNGKKLLAKGVREQKREEANMLAGALLDAEARMGDLLSRIPAQEHGKKGKFRNKLPEGITKKQSHIFQTLAENREAIEHDENAIRKNFTPSESVAIWEAMESYEHKGKLVSKVDTKRRDRAAKALGVGHTTLSKAKQVIDSGRKDLAVNEEIEIKSQQG